MELTTEQIQLWRRGIMLTIISRQEAEDLLRTGQADKISEQAIAYKLAKE